MYKPVIYTFETDETVFLNEYERGYLRVEELREHLIKRAHMFACIHRAWTVYDSKKQVSIYLTRAEWKKKAYNILNLQFHMTNEQAKGIVSAERGIKKR
jgi:hypothetical protein